MVVLNFSGVYETQEFWREENASVLELKAMSGCNCYCSEEAFISLKSRIHDAELRDIHFMDSGNYHYMTRLWVEKTEEPFQLLVLDHHTDMQPPAFGGLLSCGGWVRSSLEEIKNLCSVLIIGPPRQTEETRETEEIRETEGARRTAEADRISIGIENGCERPEKSCTENSVENRGRLLPLEELEREDAPSLEAGFLQRYLKPELPLYISLDKDIFSERVLKTNWDQGTMEEGQLFRILEVCFRLAEERRIPMLGFDICGEPEAGSDRFVSDSDRVNRRLLDFYRKHQGRFFKGAVL